MNDQEREVWIAAAIVGWIAATVFIAAVGGFLWAVGL